MDEARISDSPRSFTKLNRCKILRVLVGPSVIDSEEVGELDISLSA